MSQKQSKSKTWQKKAILNHKTFHQKILDNLDKVTQDNSVLGNVHPFDVKIGNELGIIILTEHDQNLPIDMHKKRFEKARMQKCKKLIILIKEKNIGENFYELQLFASNQFHFRCIAVGDWEELGQMVMTSGKRINTKNPTDMFSERTYIDVMVFRAVKKMFPRMSRKDLIKVMNEFRNLRNLAKAGADEIAVLPGFGMVRAKNIAAVFEGESQDSSPQGKRVKGKKKGKRRSK